MARTPREYYEQVKANTAAMYELSDVRGKTQNDLTLVEFSGTAKANKNVNFTTRVCSFETTLIVVTVTNTGGEKNEDLTKVLDSLKAAK